MENWGQKALLCNKKRESSLQQFEISTWRLNLFFFPFMKSQTVSDMQRVWHSLVENHEKGRRWNIGTSSAHKQTVKSIWVIYWSTSYLSLTDMAEAIFLFPRKGKVSRGSSAKRKGCSWIWKSSKLPLGNALECSKFCGTLGAPWAFLAVPQTLGWKDGEIAGVSSRTSLSFLGGELINIPVC